MRGESAGGRLRAWRVGGGFGGGFAEQVGDSSVVEVEGVGDLAGGPAECGEVADGGADLGPGSFDGGFGAADDMELLGDAGGGLQLAVLALAELRQGFVRAGR